tara:strand:+ start:416 stop:544 length:129 start_codon:yes stop_codon:yes gene_type:complete
MQKYKQLNLLVFAACILTLPMFHGIGIRNGDKGGQGRILGGK